jgi:membrane peptidoglycan carboxypeptidase
LAKSGGCLGSLFRLFFGLLLIITAGAIFFAWDELSEVKRVVTQARHEELPPLVVGAVVAAEDPDFYQQSRLDDVLHGSLVTHMAKGYVRDRSIGKIAKRLILSIAISVSQSKKTIANAYASHVYLGKIGGQSVEGVRRGAELYFGSPVARLDSAQAAALAATIRSPAEFNPSIKTDSATAWRFDVLERMMQAHLITTDDYDRAKKSPAMRGLAARPIGASRR